MNDLDNIFLAYDYLPDGIVIYRADGVAHTIYANKKALNMFGFDNLEAFLAFTEGDFTNIIDEEDLRQKTDLMKVDTGNALERHERYHVRLSNGEVKTIDDTARVVVLPKIGKVIVSNLREARVELVNNDESVDRVTSLLTLDRFISTCKNLVQKADAEEDAGKYNIVYFNIRNFKAYNVEHGVKMGDMVLKRLADIIKSGPSTKVATRFTGDQFVAFIESENLMDTVEGIIHEFFLDYSRHGLLLKVGIYKLKDVDEDIAISCDLAKFACDSIKHDKAHYRFFDDKLQHKISLNRYIINSLDEAIENKYIKVYYQPVVRTINGSMCGMEALARWIDPKFGFLSPADFISILESNGLIRKLDLFILSEICSDIRKREDAGLPVVPVSFNLSRMDFLDGDLFADIEKTLHKYSVSRDMINIEITESMVMNQPELLQQAIGKFGSVGYQVWMDDFGSGYSSLNVLREYKFDEIKLDMIFLRKFNNRSQNIISSIVDMAKKIGVKTLAEGVETKDQYEFLKSIGCERVQGYYFSKPLPLDEVFDVIGGKGIPVESKVQHKFYDSVSMMDFLTDRPRAIAEFNGEKYVFLFVSEEFANVINAVSKNGVEELLDLINKTGYNLHDRILDVKKAMDVDDKYWDIDFVYKGNYMRLGVMLLAKNDEHLLYSFELNNLTYGRTDNDAEKIDHVYRNLYNMYDSIFAIDLNKADLDIFANGIIPIMDNNWYEHDSNIYNDRYVIENRIHKDDYQTFKDFVRGEDILDRIEKSGRGYVSAYMRTLRPNGAYAWENHAILYAKDVSMLIYTTTFSPMHNGDFLKRLLSDIHLNLSGESEENSWLHTLGNSRSLNVFWKDENRRFLGANQTFLDTYGLKSVDDIIGKTDEDMNWHVENQPFADDENAVIQNGATIRNRLGKCVIKGKLHDIVANKEPIYKNGKVIGLLGTFFNTDDLFDEENASRINEVDTLTGLMSSRGIINSTFTYLDALENKNENFAIIQIGYGDSNAISRTYGSKNALKMLSELGEHTRNHLSELSTHTIIAGRLYSTNFVFLVKYSDRAEISELKDSLFRMIGEIHTLNGYRVTLNPEIKDYYSEDYSDRQKLIMLAMGMNDTGEIPAGIVTNTPDQEI